MFLESVFSTVLPVPVCDALTLAVQPCPFMLLFTMTPLGPIFPSGNLLAVLISRQLTLCQT